VWKINYSSYIFFQDFKQLKQKTLCTFRCCTKCPLGLQCLLKISRNTLHYLSLVALNKQTVYNTFNSTYIQCSPNIVSENAMTLRTFSTTSLVNSNEQMNLYNNPNCSLILYFPTHSQKLNTISSKHNVCLSSTLSSDK